MAAKQTNAEAAGEFYTTVSPLNPFTVVLGHTEPDTKRGGYVVSFKTTHIAVVRLQNQELTSLFHSLLIFLFR